MSWTVIVPLKPAGLRKSRLAPRLDEAARDRLSLALLDHVVAALAAHTTILLLAEAPLPGWRHGWARDDGRGLNTELAAARAVIGIGPVAVIHPDLPLLTEDDVVALLVAATADGLALAPDRHRVGTNAVAIADGRPLAFRFGAASFARFRQHGGRPCAIVRRPGLALDVDTPDDLEQALAAQAAAFAKPAGAR